MKNTIWLRNKKTWSIAVSLVFLDYPQRPRRKSQNENFIQKLTFALISLTFVLLNNHTYTTTRRPSRYRFCSQLHVSFFLGKN